MITVGQPGPGTMGEPCMLISASRAAGKFPMSTVALPMAMPLGAGEAHTMPPGTEFATAAGIPPMSTVGTAAAGVMGPPTWGLGPSNSGHTTLSPARRAGPTGISGTHGAQEGPAVEHRRVARRGFGHLSRRLADLVAAHGHAQGRSLAADDGRLKVVVDVAEVLQRHVEQRAIAELDLDAPKVALGVGDDEIGELHRR